MTTAKNIFLEKQGLEVDLNKLYSSEHREALEQICRLAMLLFARNKQWKLTKTDVRNAAVDLLTARNESDRQAKRAEAMCRLIYDERVEKAREKSAEALVELEKEMDKVNGWFSNANTRFREKAKAQSKPFLLEPDEYLQVSNFTFAGLTSSTKGLMLAILVYDIEPDKEALRNYKKAPRKVQEQIDSLNAEYKRFKSLSSKPEALLPKLDKLDGELEGIGKGQKWLYRIVGIMVVLLAGLLIWLAMGNQRQEKDPGTEIIPLQLSEEVALGVAAAQSGLVLKDLSEIQENAGFRQFSLSLTNNSPDTVYYLDALLLSLTDLPARIVSVETQVADKAHIIISEEVMDYSIRYFGTEASGSQINPGKSRFMEVLVTGDASLRQLEYSFKLAAVVHDQYSNSDTVEITSPYIIRF